jgi:predicted GIY-YIG superfamily endonuclease
MYYVYLIESRKFPDQKYIGHTDNLRERLETHNSGGSIYTKPYRSWQLKMILGFQSQEEALKFEKYLKSGAGRAFAKKRFW